MRKICSLALVATVISLGIPSAAFSAPAKPRARQQTQQQTGGINGTAKSAQGQGLPNYTVRVRNSGTGAIAATATSDNAGVFTVAGLTPGNYIVEVVNSAGQLVGMSSVVSVAAGAVVNVAVTASAAGAVGGATAGGFSLFGLGTTASVAVIAAAGTAAIVGVVAVTGNSSPSK